MKIKTSEVGQVAETWVYPVKSMRGIKQESGLTVLSSRVAGDHRRSFVLKGTKNEYPWLTSEKFPGLLLYTPYFKVPTDPENSPIQVITPGYPDRQIPKRDLNVDDPELAAEICTISGHEAYMLPFSRAYDGMPLSIMTTTDVRSLAQDIGYEVDIRQFRQNVLLESSTGNPHEETSWIGGTLIFGDRKNSARIAIVKEDKRCMRINLNIETAKQDPKILRTVVAKHGNVMGVYGNPVLREGTIEPRDRVYLTKIE